MTPKPENPLDSVLKDIISGISKRGGVTEEDVKVAWDEAVGKGAASHCKIRSLKGGRLVVNIDGSSWLYEITVQKKEILKKLAESLKGKKIKDITLRIGDLK